MKTIKIAILLVLLSLQVVSAQNNEKYYFSKTITGSFEEVTTKVKVVLKEQGFGLVTEIDMDVKIKEKISDADIVPYRVLGFCNPGFAYTAIQSEDNIGVFLPCKVIVKDIGEGNIEVVMVNPSAMMNMLGNKELSELAKEVTEKFLAALNNL